MEIVYIIQHIKTKEIYTGRTNNLRRRSNQHNNSKKGFTRRISGDWILIHAEAYRNREDAIDREFKLKHRGSVKHGVKQRIIKSLLE